MSRIPTQPVPSISTLRDELHQWRAAHPTATLTEIEQALDARWHAARAELLTELVDEADVATDCSRCGQRLVRRGTRTRTLRTQGDEPVALTRTYMTCPACGDGLFPPR